MSVLVGKKAPDFSASAVINGSEIVENFTLSQFKGTYVVLFFYPLDFTFVCPTELLEFQDKLKDFESRGVQVIGVSVDSQFSHWKWLQTATNDGGIHGVKYPLVADISKTISENYDVLAGEWDFDDDGNSIFEGTAVAYRGTFLIDKEGIVRHQVINDLPLGRNIDEAIRMVDALQFTEEHGEVCPAGWVKGKKGMKATQEGVAGYLSER